MDIKTKKKAGQSGDDGNKILRTKKIWLNVSPEEYQKISEYFEASSHKTFAHFCREKLLEKPGKVQQKNKVISEVVQSMFYQNKIGTNINQIAKRVNTLKKDYPELISDLQNELEELRRLKLSLITGINKD